MATSADFTIADVLAWARTKPADGRYIYTDSRNCALCMFLRETGSHPSDQAPAGLDASRFDPARVSACRLVEVDFAELTIKLKALTRLAPVAAGTYAVLPLDDYRALREAAGDAR